MTLWCQNFLRPETFARAIDWSLTISYKCYPGMHSPATSFPQMQQLEFWANLCWFPLILATFWATAVEQISNLWVLDSVLNFTGRKANGCMHVCTWFSVEVGARKGLCIAFFSALNPPLQKLLFIMKLCQGSNKNLCIEHITSPCFTSRSFFSPHQRSLHSWCCKYDLWQQLADQALRTALSLRE